MFGFTWNTFPKDNSDNSLVKYYSALLTLNLNHASESAKVIYSLSNEPEFDKSFLEDQLGKIEEHIKFANSNIANILINTIDEEKIRIDKYLKNIDEHLAQALIDIQDIKIKMKGEENLTPLISDLYYQIKNSEKEDHKEIIKILKLKSFGEPVLVELKK
jgi:hypothetical protein